MQLKINSFSLVCGLVLSAIGGRVQAQTHPALTDYPVTNPPYLAAYRWGAANSSGGAAANTAFSTWLDRSPVWAEDFEPTDRWDNNIEGGSWQLGEWSAWKAAVPGRRLILSVPLLPGPWDRSGPTQGEGAGQAVSFAAGAAGQYNAHFTDLANNLVAAGLGDSVLRLGWEFNGGWYTWRCSGEQANFKAYWQQIVNTMRAVPGAEKLQFCWNPALGWQQFPADQAYPGDAYVDLIGLDVYDESWLANTYPWPAGTSQADIDARRVNAWNNVTLNGDHGLTFWKNFSVTHGKLFCIPEWGVSNRSDTHGGLDSAYFVQQMHDFIFNPANNVYFHCYFDVQAGDGHHQLSPGLSGTEVTEFPLAAAKFKELFGPQNAGTGLTGTYFSNTTLTTPVEVRTDATVNFNWGWSQTMYPVPADGFGVRWTGQVQAIESGTYTFTTSTDDGVRLWVNGQLLVDKWVNQGQTNWSGTITLTAGKKYSIKMEYFDNVQSAVAQLYWKRPGQTSGQIIPQSQLYPTAGTLSPGTGTGLKAQYYTGQNFVTLVKTQTDPSVNFNWAANGPVTSVGPDNWSARWTGQIQAVETGTYTFTTSTDDGVRLWINNSKLTINHWITGSNSWSGTINLTAGEKYNLTMEYFDATGNAVAQLSWKRPGWASTQIVPQKQLYPAP